jgi:hypothetical protein
MPAKPKLYTCSIDDGGPKLHPCRRCHDALKAAGHDYETVVFGRNKPMGLFTKGKRPKLQEMTGQEKLPVLELTDGSFVTGSKSIVAWAQSPSG